MVLFWAFLWCLLDLFANEDGMADGSHLITGDSSSISTFYALCTSHAFLQDIWQLSRCRGLRITSYKCEPWLLTSKGANAPSHRFNSRGIPISIHRCWSVRTTVTAGMYSLCTVHALLFLSAVSGLSPWHWGTCKLSFVCSTAK